MCYLNYFYKLYSKYRRQLKLNTNQPTKTALELKLA